MSASIDSTVRVWSLDNFQHQYTFELPTALSLVKVYDGAQKLAVSLVNGDIRVFEFNMILQQYMKSETTIRMIKPGFVNSEKLFAGQPDFTMSICEDNSIFLRPIDPARIDEKITMYPPPSSVGIQHVVYSIRL